ncbi:hypothetical protein FA148_28245, partial [Pseudomonas aeruginosa]|nr:hypothetical protein [Pseudomonas aeruginosa]
KSEWVPSTGYLTAQEAQRDISHYLMHRYNWIRGHAEIRRKFIHLGCRLLFCKAFLQKWPHQSRGLVKVLDAVERDAIKPAEKRFG